MTINMANSLWGLSAVGTGGTYNSWEPDGTPNPVNIFLNEDFGAYSIGSDPELISGFTQVTPNSIITDEVALAGGKSYKDSSRAAATTEWANGFIHSIPGDLVEGDEAWARMRIFLPIGSDLQAIGEGDHLKWLRWRTETDLGANAGYSDIYYDEVIGRWKFIKEVAPNTWHTLTTGAGGPFDQEYGKWVTWEFYFKFHSTVGVVRMWKDGVFVNELTNIETLSTPTDVVKSMYFRTYWNGGIPKQQDWYYDNVAIALNGAGRTDSTQLNTDSEGNLYIGNGV